MTMVVFALFILLSWTTISCSLSDHFDEHKFTQKIQNTLARIRKVLSTEKHPMLAPASEVPHEFSDKYTLVELLTNVAISSTTVTLEFLGLTHNKQSIMLSWLHEDKKEVILRFTSEPSCTFSRKAKREESNTSTVEEETKMFGGHLRFTTKKYVRTITEYFWELKHEYSLQVCSGGGSLTEKCIDLLNDQSEQELMSSSNIDNPVPEASRSVSEVIISPFLRQIDSTSLLPSFSINRNSSSCITPARNPGVGAMVAQFLDLSHFCNTVSEKMRYLYSYSKQKIYFSSLYTVPILDFFEREPEGGVPTQPVSRSRHLSPEALNLLLLEEEENLRAKFSVYREDLRLLGNHRDTMTAAGAKTLLAVHHLIDICASFQNSVLYVENMMRRQLVEAIGKEVSGKDLVQYMQFYAQKFVRPEASPAPFAYSVRRSTQQSPEGIISIEQSFPNEAATPVPLYTLSRKVFPQYFLIGSENDAPPLAPEMSFALDASTRVRFEGEQYVHTYLHQSFSSTFGDKDESKPTFTARARQFSSFILLLGKISSATTFEPTYGIIVKNRDVLQIALNLAVIPTQKEFRDAIKSLSRNQQAFATAFRTMQLEGSLFGVVVIQIKPQLERVLNLPQQSLQQEIELTEDLMTLFVDYQVPSDLLCDDEHAAITGGGNVSTSAGVERVRENVKAIKDMINRSKENYLKEKKQKQEDNDGDHWNLHKGPNQLAGLAKEAHGAPILVQMPARAKRSHTISSYAKSIYKYFNWGLEGTSRIHGNIRGNTMSAHPFLSTESASINSAAVNNDFTSDEQAQLAPEFIQTASTSQLSGVSISVGSSLSDSSTAESASINSAAVNNDLTHDERTQPAPPTDLGSYSSAGYGFPRTYDWTALPQQLQDAFEKRGERNIIRPTIVMVDENSWVLESQKNMFTPSIKVSLDTSAQQQAKRKAFDLLDALTKSGALSVTDASLYVLITATHIFDSSVLETLVQQDVNPLQELQQSLLIMLKTLHGKPLDELVTSHSRGSLAQQYPDLFEVQ